MTTRSFAILFGLASVLSACGARSSLPIDGDAIGGDGDGDGDGPCDAGGIVRSTETSYGIEVVGDDVYLGVIDGTGTGSIVRVSTLGSSEPVVIIDGLVQPGDFTTGNGLLYASDLNRIQSVPLDGSSAPTPIYGGSEAPAFQMVADDEGLYWAPAPQGTTTGRIMYLPFGGAAAAPFFEGLGGLSGIALAGPSILFTAVTVPFGNGETNIVASVNKKGDGTVTVYASQRQQVGSPMLVGNRVGWLETSVARTGPMGVYTIPFDGGGGPTLLLQPESGHLPLLARSRDTYVAMTTYDEADEGAVLGASLEDPTRKELARGPEIPSEPAVADEFVAWAIEARGNDPQAADARWVCR